MSETIWPISVSINDISLQKFLFSYPLTFKGHFRHYSTSSEEAEDVKQYQYWKAPEQDKTNIVSYCEQRQN